MSFDLSLDREPEKSSYFTHLLNQGNLTEIAKYLVARGYTPVPIKITEEGLYPLVKLREYKLEGTLQDKLLQVVRVFSTKKANGIAIKAGRPSNIIIIDIDDPELFNKFYPIQELAELSGYVVKTKDEGHYHIGFLYDPELKNANLVYEMGFEIKSDGTLATFYTTVADAWYTPLKLEEQLTPLPKDLKERIKELIAIQEEREKSRVKPPKEQLLPKEELQNILRKLKEKTGRAPSRWRNNPPTWRALCPVHNDRNPSLDVEVYEDGILFHCWSQSKCPHEEIARALGYEIEPPKPKPEPKTEPTTEPKPKPKPEKPETDPYYNAFINAFNIYDEDEENRPKQQQGKISISVLVRGFLNRKKEEGEFSFWLSQFEEPYISITPYQHIRIESSQFKDYLQEFSCNLLGKALHNQALQEVLAFCRVWARESGLKFNTFTRIGYDEQKNFIEINLLREDYKVLRITTENIELDYPKLKFVNTKNQLQILFDYNLLKSLDLKRFTEDELLNLFKQLFNIQTREELALLLAWMLKTFYPKGEYPILTITGEREGVGKTTTSRFIVQLLDPNIAPLKTFPRTIDDLYTLAKNNFILCFDNLSYISDDMSDALCQLSTGGSLSKRKLYTDSEIVDLPLKNPLILNSIFNILQRRDLRRRSVVIELKTPVERKPARQLEETFKKIAPVIYSYLVLCTQEALKEKIIHLDYLDVADFCEWIARAHPVFFTSGEEFVQILKENREEIAKELLESSLLLPIIEEKLKADAFGFWQTTAKEILEELKKRYPNERNLPSTPEKVGRELKKLISDLEAANIRTEFIKTKKKRVIVFSYIQPNNKETKEEEEGLNW